MAAGIVMNVSTGVMRPLLTKLSKLVEDKYNNLKGVRKEIVSLSDELSTMHAFLEEIEDADELRPLDKEWRNHVREMSYDMEDCIDDFILNVGGGDAKEGILQKVAQRLRTLRARHQIANRIQELKTHVQVASQRQRSYKLDNYVPSSSDPLATYLRLPALYMESSNLVGIDDPKEELIKWIVDEKQPLRVVSIVGFGGLGKTTLANQVYRQTSGEFDCKVFVSVSQRFDVIGLLRSISSQLGQQDPYVHDVHGMIENLREYLHRKRYFIVIDDLWDSHVWDVIRCVFPENNLRSRVIVTTRSRSVGTACCYPDECIFDMEPLSHEHSRILFLSRIFGSEEGCPPKYKEVSDEILKRCGGLPLAIITIASLLAVQKTRLKEGWEYIKNSLSSQFATNPTLEGMRQILGLSYKHLPRHLRACFLYFGMYPEDHLIHTDGLMKQWVAEGFVSNLCGLDAVDVAESYFIELVSRSLIQPVEVGYNNKVLSCKVHDMMLDLIISKCTEGNFVRMVHKSPQMATRVNKLMFRRLSVVSAEDEDGRTMGTASLSHIRSLAIFRGSHHTYIFNGSMHVPPLSEFKFLRVLLLEFWCFYETTEMKVVDLADISQLFHLRYLRICSTYGKNYIIRLPDQIRGLHQLETLEIGRTPVQSIPSDIALLPCLSHLSIPSIARLPLPDGIGNMKSLRTLKNFDLLRSTLETIKGIHELTNLRRLGLSFHERDGEMVLDTAVHALCSSLKELGNLKYLHLSNFNGINVSDGLSSLSPDHRCHIEELDLSACVLPQVPKWFSRLRDLYSLCIDVHNICKDDLRLIGELPSLINFSIRIDAPAEKIVIKHCAGFSHLSRFEFRCDMPSCLIFETGSMPSLQTLYIQFFAEKWDGTTPVGMEHLSGLQDITVRNSGNFVMEQSHKTAVESAFRRAIETHPSRPVFTSVYFAVSELKKTLQCFETEQCNDT